jgi:small subunit ribosomal protein S20
LVFYCIFAILLPVNSTRFDNKGDLMAQHVSAEKAARQAKKKNLRNTSDLSKMKTAIKRVREEKDKTKAAEALKKTTKLLDQLAAKKVIHKNKAANQKSALTKFVNKLN